MGTMKVQTIKTLSKLYWRQEASSLLFLLFDALALPCFIFYFGWRMTTGAPEALPRFLVDGLIVGIGVGATSRVGFAILSDVHKGRLSLVKSAGVRTQDYLGLHVCVGMLFGCFSVASGCLIVNLFGLATLGFAQIGLLVVIAALSGIAMGAIGGAIAISSSQFKQGYTWLSSAAVGLTFLSPVLYSPDALIEPLRTLSLFSPLTHSATLMQSAFAGETGPGTAWGFLVCLAMGLTLAVRRMLR
ncbi:ABC transporter permease [Roseobacter weihaiensis]|uniref:ABC transporter permease n=1 Tax=Roseobacter weihaiensis TaxID=2763262 RepID=UPI001D0B435F|nr:ABC transporter permease [Roseobacter sp. H9]